MSNPVDLNFSILRIDVVASTYQSTHTCWLTETSSQLVTKSWVTWLFTASRSDGSRDGITMTHDWVLYSPRESGGGRLYLGRYPPEDVTSCCILNATHHRHHSSNYRVRNRVRHRTLTVTQPLINGIYGARQKVQHDDMTYASRNRSSHAVYNCNGQLFVYLAFNSY